MARGFGSTYGVGASDKVTSTFNTLSNGKRSYFARVFRNGFGGNGFGRIFEANGQEYALVTSSRNSIEYQRNFSGGLVWWYGTVPATGAWFTYGVSYDAASTANDPIIYINGAPISLTESSAPSGSATTGAQSYYIGNNAAGTRNWDGMAADFAVWDGVLLSADEHAAMAKGASPLLVRPSALVEHLPLLRESVSTRRAAPTITGTAVQPHPRIILPRRKGIIGVPAAVGGGGLSIPVAMHHYRSMRAA